MKLLIVSIFSTVSMITLAIYDFLCVCRIIGKEELAERIWKYILPNKPYDEKVLFVIIRPMLLNISLAMFMLSGGLASGLFLFKIILYSAPALALGVIIKNSTQK